MKRLSILVILAFGIIFIGCSDDDNNVAGPILSSPSNLTATALSDNQIHLSWLDSSYIETGFRIQKSSDGQATWVRLGETGRDTTAWLDTGLLEGTDYSYRVYTIGYESESDPSEVVTTKTLALPPTNLMAVADSVIFTTISLTWEDLSEKETGYLIQRKLGSRGVYEDVIELDADVVEYVDEGLEQNTTYYYHVRAMIDSVGSLWSNEAAANTTVLTPRPPTDLVAIAQTAHSIRLTWSDNSLNNDGFLVERSLMQDEGWELADSLIFENVQSYSNAGLSDNTTYYFRITAYNSYGNSAYTNVASATTPSGPPNAPTNLISDGATYEVINIAWDDNSDDESYFQLQRKVGGAQLWNDHARIESDLSVYADTDVMMNTEYHYRIKAVNNAGSSAYSNELIVVTPDGPPYPPSITNIETQSISSIRLIWSPHRYGNQDGFYLERKAEQDTVFTQVGGELGKVINTYTDTGLDPDTWYTYRLYAFNEVGQSDYSTLDSSQTWTTIVLDEGFEDYIVGEIPPPPWDVDEQGGSRARVYAGDRHNGSNCLQLTDTNPMEIDSAYCRAGIITRPVEKGIVECWLNIANNGYFGIIGADPVNYITFRIQFFGDQRIVFQNGASLVSIITFPVDEWFKLKIIFDAPTRRYSFEINDEPRAENALLARSDHEGNSQLIFLGFTDATLTYANIDDILVDDTSELPSIMQTWGYPGASTEESTARVDDIRSVVGPVR
ncbi:fibronectin type III domain-containing protein [bacterium]|nr:fibronectin type III domain-containing protein [bacterium]